MPNPPGNRPLFAARIPTIAPDYFQSSNVASIRSASASGQATSFCDSRWEDHWWLGQETWASGGSWQNAIYDEYNYQYRWTKTWQGQGDGAVTSSASNHVTGIENGFESGWWTHTVPEGSGNSSSSSTSWGGPWDHCYHTTVSYRGFWEARYYGRDYGGGSGEEDYIAYVGDAFSEASPPGSGSTAGMFPFAYSEEELLLGQGQGGGERLVLGKANGQQEDTAAADGSPSPLPGEYRPLAWSQHCRSIESLASKGESDSGGRDAGPSRTAGRPTTTVERGAMPSEGNPEQASESEDCSQPQVLPLAPPRCMACHGGFTAGLVRWQGLSAAERSAVLQAVNAPWPVIGANGVFLEDFLLGQGETRRYYGPDCRETREMRSSPGAAKLRDAFYKSGCKGVERFYYGTYEAARENPPWGHTTPAQVGGFTGSARNNGDGTVTFTIYNEAGTHSFFLPFSTQ